MNGMDTPLDFYILTYESNGALSRSDEMNNSQNQDPDSCDACQASWWNSYRVPEKYTERDIGRSRLSRRCDGVISMAWLTVVLGGYFVTPEASFPSYSENRIKSCRFC
ncbi:hypothetical protein BSL78_16156 [Apostichopus japonicus]|uniref:Uncharacterized protein n=1 Tax=Stichopus japonicus TaxID=307972 RepID=A0A2G8KG38_STIJA|nr:hypothetical protein BSL78_16156 [Apostichopus japonicus]